MSSTNDYFGRARKIQICRTCVLDGKGMIDRTSGHVGGTKIRVVCRGGSGITIGNRITLTLHIAFWRAARASSADGDVLRILIRIVVSNVHV